MLMLFVTITSVLTKFIEGRAICILFIIKVLLFCSNLSARPAMIQDPTRKIIIIDDFHPYFTENLEASGIECHYHPDVPANEVADLIYPFEIVAVRSKVNFDKTILDRLPNLKCIARGGAGMDNIDETYAQSKSIELLNAPEGNRDAVAEHTIGLLISLSKNIVKSHNEVAKGVWNREANRGWEIGGKTIGLIGFGNTGSRVARKLKGFDCKVLAYDKYLTSNETSQDAELVSLETLLKSSDVISFHVPLTSETKWMLSSNLISQMKEQVVLINTSRGGVAKMEDVLDGIKGGKIKSFACDVLEDEKIENYTEEKRVFLNTLINDYQIIVTPHVAGWSVESYFKISQVLSEKVKAYTTKAKNI